MQCRACAQFFVSFNFYSWPFEGITIIIIPTALLATGIDLDHSKTARNLTSRTSSQTWVNFDDLLSFSKKTCNSNQTWKICTCRILITINWRYYKVLFISWSSRYHLMTYNEDKIKSCIIYCTQQLYVLCVTLIIWLRALISWSKLSKKTCQN